MIVRLHEATLLHDACVLCAAFLYADTHLCNVAWNTQAKRQVLPRLHSSTGTYVACTHLAVRTVIAAVAINIGL